MTTSNAALQNKYKELIQARNFVELARSIEKTKIPPLDNIVRVGYKTYLREAPGNRVKLFYLMKLKEITGISPEDNILQEAFDIALGMDSPLVLEALMKRTDANKLIFSGLNASLQRVYNDYINQGRFKDIAKLMDLSGITPVEELVHKGYEEYLMDAKFISFTGLRKQTKIDPDKGMVHQVYYNYNSNYLKTKTRYVDEARTWLRRLHKLKKITRIDPPEGMELDDPSIFEEEE